MSRHVTVDVVVPEGRLPIAQRFHAGNWQTCDTRSPGGTNETHTLSADQPSLRDFGSAAATLPSVETLGYCQFSLRERLKSWVLVRLAPLAIDGRCLAAWVAAFGLVLAGLSGHRLAYGEETIGAAKPPAASVDARDADVRKLIERYFKSWSSRDLDRYGQCFMPQAAVQLVDEQGRLITMPLAPFLKSQKLAHERAKQPMTETPQTIEVRFEAKLARAVVRWKLVEGERTTLGYDHFTLMETPAGWRIANLIFYNDAPAKP